jgi:hypothetical protein
VITQGSRRAWVAGVALAGILASSLGSPAIVSAGDVAMVPTRIVVSVKPGEDYTTVVQVQHIDDGTENRAAFRLSLTKEDWTLSERGRVDFFAGAPGPQSATPWLHFSPGEEMLPPGKAVPVRVSIIVPKDTPPGEYRTALIAQPRMPYRPVAKGEARLDMQLRLASMIYVHVPPVTQDVELTNLLVLSDGKQLYLEPEFYNRGSRSARFFDQFEVYPADTDPSAVQPVCRLDYAESGVALPNQIRYLRHDLPCELPPGRYRVVYRAEIGESLPILEGEREFMVPLPKEYVRTPDPNADPSISRR